MENGKKALSKKEKIVGVIASTAIMAVPFMVAPVQQGYALNTEFLTGTLVNSDKIQTIVLREQEKQYIDLNALYNAKSFVVTNDSLNTADGNSFLLQRGILEINAKSLGNSNNSTGKATFTVTGIRSDTFTEFNDEFEVLVIPNPVPTNPTKINIKDVVSILRDFPTNYLDKGKVQELLGQIDVHSTTIQKVDPFNSVGNQIPVKKLDAPSSFETVVGMEIDLQGIGYVNNTYFDVTHYFNDPDGISDEPLNAVFLPIADNKVELINNEATGGQTLKIKQVGTVSLPILVFDHHGGITLTNIDFVIQDTETYILDDESTVTLDLKKYFVGSEFQGVTHYALDFWSSPVESHIYDLPFIHSTEDDPGNETAATFTPREGIYRVSAMFDANPIDSFFVSIKNSNALENRNLLAGSKLAFNLQNLFPLAPGSSVTYSVYLNNTSVTGLTYGIENTNSLYFDADETPVVNSPLNVTVTAKDEINNITVKEKIEVSAISLYKSNANLGFEVTYIFNHYEEWNDVVVSSPFGKNGSPFGSYNTVYTENSGSGSTLVTLNYRDKFIFKIPFTYPTN